MIRSISPQGFRSHANATLPLAPLSFLIGQNASGKSNALEAVRFPSWLANGSGLDDIEKRIQNQDTVVRGRAADLFHDVESPSSLKEELDRRIQ